MSKYEILLLPIWERQTSLSALIGSTNTIQWLIGIQAILYSIDAQPPVILLMVKSWKKNFKNVQTESRIFVSKKVIVSLPPQCYGWPIHAAHILQIRCRFAPYSCRPRPSAHPSASCAPCTIYPSTYPSIHYHCLPGPSAHPYPSLPTALRPTRLYCSIVYH